VTAEARVGTTAPTGRTSAWTSRLRRGVGAVGLALGLIVAVSSPATARQQPATGQADAVEQGASPTVQRLKSWVLETGDNQGLPFVLIDKVNAQVFAFERDGLLLGATGGNLIDRPLLSQFQELLNAASALVLFEVGRKMDLAWLLRSGRQGGSLLLATLARLLAVALEAGADDHHEPDADRHREHGGQHGGAAVLVQRLAVTPDAVDAVGAALHLRECRRHRDQGEAEAERERHLAGELGLLGPFDGGGERVAVAGPGRERVDDLRHHGGRALLVEVGGEPGEGQQERHDGQARLERERPGVGEPVAVAEPHEGLDRDLAQTVVAGEVPSVLCVELVAVHLGGDGHGAGGGHGGRLGVPPGRDGRSGPAAPTSGAPVSTPDRSRRTNWSGNLTYSARDLVRPASVAELQEVVAAAAVAGDRVRALGSRHSFSSVADTDGVHVSTRDLGLSVEIEGDDAAVAVVPGAMTYAEVAPVLQARGRALHNLGSLPHISVAGACATGTHGSGDDLGYLATAVVGVELVTASGELVRLDSTHADFGGAVLSLGALGVVTRLWLRTEPTYEVRQRVWEALPAAEVAERERQALVERLLDTLAAGGWGPYRAIVEVLQGLGEGLDDTAGAPDA